MGSLKPVDEHLDQFLPEFLHARDTATIDGRNFQNVEDDGTYRKLSEIMKIPKDFSKYDPVMRLKIQQTEPTIKDKEDHKQLNQQEAVDSLTRIPH